MVRPDGRTGKFDARVIAIVTREETFIRALQCAGLSRNQESMYIVDSKAHG
jgi:hypothetical protein